MGTDLQMDRKADRQTDRRMDMKKLTVAFRFPQKNGKAAGKRQNI
jgi:hypothetical protein